MKKVFMSLCLLGVSFVSHAGVAATTAHSRANCGGFNESITWYLGHYFDWRVESHHFLSIKHTTPAHVINTGKMHTWRAAAYHPNEAYSSRGDSWYVAGYHFWYPSNSKKERLDTTTMAVDCGLDSGWWDH